MSKRVFTTTFFLFLASCPAFAQRSWQQVTVPSIREVAANFKAPPHEYGAISAFTGWDGPDLEALKPRTRPIWTGCRRTGCLSLTLHRDASLQVNRHIFRRGTWTR